MFQKHLIFVFVIVLVFVFVIVIVIVNVFAFIYAFVFFTVFWFRLVYGKQFPHPTLRWCAFQVSQLVSSPNWCICLTICICICHCLLVERIWREGWYAFQVSWCAHQSGVYQPAVFPPHKA